MDWKVIVSTFITIFLAELGDKTQITTFTISGVSENKLSVFIGSALALICASLFAVMMGEIIGKFINQKLLNKLAAVSFLLMGFIYFYKGFIE